MDPQGRPHGDDDWTVPRAPNMPPPTRVSAWAGPPAQGPGGWQPPAPPAKPPQNRWMWVMIAATVVIVVASVIIVVVSTTGDDDSTTAASTSATQPSSTTKASVPKTSTPKTTQAPPPPAPPVAPDAVMGFLLTAPEVASVYAVPALIEKNSGTDPIGGDSPIPLECRSAWAPAHKETYDPTGFTGVARKTIGDDPPTGLGIAEAVVAYPDAAAATAARDRVVAAWRNCQNIDFTEKLGGRDHDWKTGVVGNNDGVNILLLFSQSPPGSPPNPDNPNCQRAITVARNVVVDVLGCGPGTGNQGFTVTRDIAQKITAAP